MNDPDAVMAAFRRAFAGQLGRPADRDAYAPLRAIIGLVQDGPTDASIYHDERPRGGS